MASGVVWAIWRWGWLFAGGPAPARRWNGHRAAGRKVRGLRGCGACAAFVRCDVRAVARILPAGSSRINGDGPPDLAPCLRCRRFRTLASHPHLACKLRRRPRPRVYSPQIADGNGRLAFSAHVAGCSDGHLNSRFYIMRARAPPRGSRSHSLSWLPSTPESHAPANPARRQRPWPRSTRS